MESNEFADPSRIVRWTRVLWIVLTVAEVFLFFSYLLQYQFLLGARSGAYGGRSGLLTAARANDLRHGVISIIAAALLIVAFIMFLRWVHRAMYNVRALGATGVETPAWTVGCFFIPMINLFMPYIAMSQIWRGSIDAPRWNALWTSPVVLVWWLFQLAVSFCGIVVFFQSKNAHSLDGLQLMTTTGLIFSCLEIIRNVLIIWLMSKVTQSQIAQHRRATTQSN